MSSDTTPQALHLDEDDASFRSQMNEISRDVGAFILIAESAIPVTDAIRGYYDAAGRERPYLTHMLANRRESYPYMETRARGTSYDAEVARLASEIPAATPICIVEQYTDTGRTLTYAANVALSAGIKVVHGMAGDWYEDARYAGVSIDALSSNFSDDMYRIGQLAFTNSSTNV